MSFNDIILNKIENLGSKGYTIAEIAKQLNFKSKHDKKELSKAIKRLVKKGNVIEKRKGQYVAASKSALLRGNLRGNKRGFAFLIREDGGEDIFIPNKSLKGAMHGDTVYARLVGDSEGVVVSIAEKGIHQLVGTLIFTGKHYFVVPDEDNYFKDIYVPANKLNGAKVNSKVVVSIKTDPVNNKPVGNIESILGKAGERNAEVLSILRNYGFNECFPDKVIEASEKIVYDNTVSRKNLTNLLTITIDGEDAKDFDDAISVEKIDEGYRLYVHIADVSHYVKRGGIIDKEAYERATSVYFPGSVFPMLPESISNGVCSLRPNEEKLTLTVVMDIDYEGNVKNEKFYETVTLSDYRMTYDKVTKILNGDEKLLKEYSGIVGMLRTAKELADIITKKRNENGSINFRTKESKIILNEEGEIEDIYPYPTDISNNIIEQFMITANETVAKYISKKELPCIYRVHEPINEKKLEAFIEFIKGFGYNLDLRKGVSPKLFSDLLEEIKGQPCEHIINRVMLRSMQKAKYTIVNSGHFGLSLDYYCHFTSPIRRYPDLMVHRILKALINKKTNEKYMEMFRTECEKAAAQSTEREIAAERAERDIEDYYKALFMTKHIGERYEGIISGVVNSGLFVSLENTVEGFVGIDDLPKDRYDIDDKNYRIVGTKYVFSMSDAVEVEIKSANVEARNVDMYLVSNVSKHLKK